jgi:glycosyltransferase 2 family protein
VSSLPGLGELRARFAEVNPLLLALIGLMKLCSSLSNVVAFREVFCRRMSRRFSYELGMAEQATNVLLPTGGAGGLALGAWALRQGGMSTEFIARRSVAFFVITSIPNFVCAGVLGPLLLAGVLPGQAPTVPTAVFTGLVWGVALLVAALPLLIGRIRPPRESGGPAWKLWTGAVALANGIRDTGALLRSGSWRAIGGAAGYMGFDTIALWIAFMAFGPAPPIGPLIFGYVLGQLGGLIPLPGGIGGTDGGLIGALVLYGSPLSQAVAAVLAYRVFQVGVPAVLGSIAFVQLRRRLGRSDSPAKACAPLADPLPEGERAAA